VTATPFVPGSNGPDATDGPFQKVITQLQDNDGNDYDASNPLPIQDNTNAALAGYELSGGDDNNRMYGYVKTNGAWYIQKFDSSNDTYLYVKGNSDFATNWGNRASLSYGYFNEVF